jgi:hypothetical protein
VLYGRREHTGWHPVGPPGAEYFVTYGHSPAITNRAISAWRGRGWPGWLGLVRAELADLEIAVQVAMVCWS